MKVSELIEDLKKLDQDYEIIVWYDRYEKQVPEFELVKCDEGDFYAHIAE